MSWIWFILFIISVVTNIFCFIGIRRALVKTESYDAFFSETQRNIINVIKKMKDIDIRGSFQADDEVGDVFKILLNLVESLDTFLISESDDETTKA